MVQPLPLGESIWLELPWSLDVGQRASLQPPDLASSCSQLHTPPGAPPAATPLAPLPRVKSGSCTAVLRPTAPS